MPTVQAEEPSTRTVEADLLVAGGTESGCAAAVQAARMGIRRIVLVNDIEWLGGQFSAEALGAIDENRAHGYDGTVPIPRSGIFREVIDAIEDKNAELYGGIRRPSNGWVITASRPAVSEQIFRELVAPYEKSGEIQRFSNYQVDTVLITGKRVEGVRFTSTDTGQPPLVVNARMTIDASDWGDVIKGSGAKWDAGMDAKAEFDEPSAPESGEPATDMNPITWCMILVEKDQETLFPKPAGYDPRYFTGTWGWINEEFAYTTRRLVDGKGFEEIDHPDVILVNNPPIDYPLDTYPAHVADALEATEPGASKKSIVAMTPEQRGIVLQDARNHSLNYYYHLQKNFPKFRRMALSDEFGTPDNMPPKPYIRESLRLVSQYIVREQDVTGFESRSNYATTMFPDAVFSWQFELDFHPTRRHWTTNLGEAGPWVAEFRGARRFGRGGTGRSVFPLRALVPQGIEGLLGAQKNLGYTSIVSSSCRLHDQSIHAGQASGAVAAVSLKHDASPADFFRQPERLAEIWNGLLTPEGGMPLVIWPFADVDPTDPGFVAIQQLALRRILNLSAADILFRPEEPTDEKWLHGVLCAIEEAGYSVPAWSSNRVPETRREAAQQLWVALASQQLPPLPNIATGDADGDGIPDESDPLPFTSGTVSWQANPATDGLPDVTVPFPAGTKAYNFTSAEGSTVPGYENDIGQPFLPGDNFGWLADLSRNTRLRHAVAQPLRDGFVFTRGQDVWECVVENGTWTVYACLGDAAHEQPGQNLRIEGTAVTENISTDAGRHHELQTEVTVRDGRLTVTLGRENSETNTCLNWLILIPIQ